MRKKRLITVFRGCLKKFDKAYAKRRGFSIETTLAEKTKEIIRKYNFIIKKNLGQNFLIDRHVLNKIVSAAGISENDVVIEVGPGIGTLTQALCESAYKVIAIEIDKTLIPVLEDTLSDYENIEIINGDILKIDLKEILEKHPDKCFKMVANLPYYITTPIIMSVLEKKLPFESLTVMVQKEVGLRMKASPGSKDYGALSLAVQYYAKPCLAANVPLNCFIPRPNVDSTVIKLTIFKSQPVSLLDEALMFKIIKCAFSQRRKTLVNCLYNSGDFHMTKEQLINFLSENGYDERIRGESLTLEQFADITNSLKNMVCDYD